MAESLKQVEELARRHERSQRARGRLKNVLRASLAVSAFKDATQEALAEEMKRNRAALEQARAAAEANAAEEAARRTEAKARLKKVSEKVIEAGREEEKVIEAGREEARRAELEKARAEAAELEKQLALAAAATAAREAAEAEVERELADKCAMLEKAMRDQGLELEQATAGTQEGKEELEAMAGRHAAAMAEMETSRAALEEARAEARESAAEEVRRRGEAEAHLKEARAQGDQAAEVAAAAKLEAAQAAAAALEHKEAALLRAFDQKRVELEQLSAKQAALEREAHGAKVQDLGKRHASAVSQLTQRLSKLESTVGMVAAELGMGGAVARARADVVGRRIDALATELGLELPTVRTCNPM